MWWNFFLATPGCRPKSNGKRKATVAALVTASDSTTQQQLLLLKSYALRTANGVKPLKPLAVFFCLLSACAKDLQNQIYKLCSQCGGISF